MGAGAGTKWKGGHFIAPDGYVRILNPGGYERGDPYGKRYLLEHRYVAEQMLGRALQPTEVVHHKNHDRADNRPENLEVLPSVSAHRRLHAEEWRAQHAVV